jgi:Acyl-CoA thioesterase N-terminal domain
MSAQGGAGCRAPTSLRTMSALDYGWWASDGPTAGYLARRTIDALEQSPGAGRGQVRHVHVQVLRLPAADAIDISVASARDTHGISRLTVTFGQGGEFAVATLTVGPRLGHSGTGDAMPPAALPLDAYVPMSTPSRTLPQSPLSSSTARP